jgi:CotS family spore coat protein
LYDSGLSVLEKYGLTAKSTYRGRGSLICNTDQGLLLIKEFRGSAKKLEGQEELLQLLEGVSDVQVDALLKNSEEQLVSFNKDKIPYFVKHWYEGRECDTKSKEDIIKSVKALAAIHKVMHKPVEENYVKDSLLEEYKRHNAELKKIQRFIRTRQQKNYFEIRYLKSVESFLKQGEEVVARLADSGYELLRSQALIRGDVCHGEFNQHNVLILGSQMAVTNFDKWNYDIQMADLYQFMRKILEKHNWDAALGQQILQTYQQEKPLSKMEMENLKLRFSYPEKYWKLANHYYNHRKAWISGKSGEKLDTIIRQRDEWVAFLHKLGE